MKQFYLSAKAVIGQRCRIAIRSRRDQFQLIFWVVFLALGGAHGSAHAETMLNILTLPQRLDSRLIQEFENSTKISVRIEFVTSPLEFEAKIKALPNSWDVVFADEQRLVSLTDDKLLKAIPNAVLIPPNLMGLSRRGRANTDGRAFINLMADPLGIMYLSETKSSKIGVDWNWLVDPSINPQWRSRVALFKDERLNLIVAAKATGAEFPVDLDDKRKELLSWIEQAKLQGRNTAFEQVVTSFLAKKMVAALSWQSDYLIASRYVKNLEFAVPSSGTYFERIGLGLVAGSRNENAALEFIKFIHDKRDQLAQRRGLMPLHASEMNGSSVRNWRVFSDDIVWFSGRTPASEKLLQSVESLAVRYKKH